MSRAPQLFPYGIGNRREKRKQCKALNGEREKPKIAGQRHGEELPFLQNWEDVNPTGSGPKVPELPEDTANPACAEQGAEAGKVSPARIAPQ